MVRWITATARPRLLPQTPSWVTRISGDARNYRITHPSVTASSSLSHHIQYSNKWPNFLHCRAANPTSTATATNCANFAAKPPPPAASTGTTGSRTAEQDGTVIGSESRKMPFFRLMPYWFLVGFLSSYDKSGQSLSLPFDRNLHTAAFLLHDFDCQT